MPPTHISFVRHGHVHNPQEVFYGRLPGFSLSQAGRRQAQAAATVLQDSPVTAIFGSPQQRARETAQIILAPHANLTLQISPLLAEIYTPFDGRPLEELLARQWDTYTHVDPPYEQPEDVFARARQFTKVRQTHAGGHVVAVTHGDLIAFMILWTRGAAITPQNKGVLTKWGLPDDYPEPASISTFTYHTAAEDEVPRLTYVTPALPPEG